MLFKDMKRNTFLNPLLKYINCHTSSFQKQAALIQQLEEELRMSHLRNPEADIQHLEALYAEKEHMTKEIYLLRETIKVISQILC